VPLQELSLFLTTLLEIGGRIARVPGGHGEEPTVDSLMVDPKQVEYGFERFERAAPEEVFQLASLILEHAASPPSGPLVLPEKP